MRTMLIVIPLLAMAGEAYAMPKYNPTRMSCETVGDTVRENGKVMLVYPSARIRGKMLYDTYVSSRRFCRPGEMLSNVTVPSGDRLYCAVQKCRPDDRDRGGRKNDQQPNPQ